jgi:type VI secretion system secreted protein VgrG
LNYTMPTLPRVAMPDVPAKFNLMLMDAPGPSGVALANTEWHVVRAADAQEACMSSEVIMQGTSNAKGKVELSSAQEKNLKQFYNQSPNKIWIIYETQARQLWLSKDTGNWTEDQKMEHALDAMGYSDQLGSVKDDHINAFHNPLAQNEYKTRIGQKLLKKLEGM